MEVVGGVGGGRMGRGAGEFKDEPAAADDPKPKVKSSSAVEKQAQLPVSRPSFSAGVLSPAVGVATFTYEDTIDG